MIKNNNKGVTLIELLIVIVVMGIIAAFSIPAVGSIIDNTKRDALYNDALQIENAAKMYCAQNAGSAACTTNQMFDYDDLAEFVDGLDTDYYNTATNYWMAEKAVAGDVTALRAEAVGDWMVRLQQATGINGSLEWDWAVPSQRDSDWVDTD